MSKKASRERRPNLSIVRIPVSARQAANPALFLATERASVRAGNDDDDDFGTIL